MFGFMGVNRHPTHGIFDSVLYRRAFTVWVMMLVLSPGKPQQCRSGTGIAGPTELIAMFFLPILHGLDLPRLIADDFLCHLPERFIRATLKDRIGHVD